MRKTQTNIRTAAKSGSTSLGTVSQGTVIAVTGIEPGGWFAVTYNGISGYVYADANANGVRNSESGIPQVTLILTGMTTLSETVLRAQQTDANGFYAFGGMAPGTYRVRELQAGDYVDGAETAGFFGRVKDFLGGLGGTA